MRNRKHAGQRRLSMELLEDRRVLATLTVSLDTDAASSVDDGQLTLREAIAYVNGDFPQPSGELKGGN